MLSLDLSIHLSPQCQWISLEKMTSWQEKFNLNVHLKGPQTSSNRECPQSQTFAHCHKLFPTTDGIVFPRFCRAACHCVNTGGYNKLVFGTGTKLFVTPGMRDELPSIVLLQLLSQNHKNRVLSKDIGERFCALQPGCLGAELSQGSDSGSGSGFPCRLLGGTYSLPAPGVSWKEEVIREKIFSKGHMQCVNTGSNTQTDLWSCNKSLHKMRQTFSLHEFSPLRGSRLPFKTRMCQILS